jgi:cleavage and polyadenylation specificity factor subunit 5
MTAPWVVYPQNRYEFHSVEKPKHALGSEDASSTKVLSPIEKLAKRYESEGMRRTVSAVVLVHVHSHPHVLLLVDNVTKEYKL